jgi:hypothetical protein
MREVSENAIYGGSFSKSRGIRGGKMGGGDVSYAPAFEIRGGKMGGGDVSDCADLNIVHV